MALTANTNSTTRDASTLDELLQQIALDHLFVETLETRNSDSLDFHDVSVWAIKAALNAAFDAGKQAGSATHTDL